MKEPTQKYSTKEWEQRKDLITKLYRPPISQKEVLRELSRNMFHPSLSMLKKRIRKWGIEKNNKASDIAKALQLTRTRKFQGKKSGILIGNRMVTTTEINRYLRRKGVCASELIERAAFFPVNHRVEVYTPPPSPRVQQAPIDRPEEVLDNTSSPLFEEFRNIRSRAILASPLESTACTQVIRRTLTGPAELELLQDALRFNARYYDCLFHLPVTQTGFYEESRMPMELPEEEHLTGFTNGMWRGRELLLEGRAQSAFYYFNQAFEKMHSAMQGQSRKFLPELYKMILNFQIGQYNILKVMLDFLIKLSSETKNVHPVVTEIAIRLLRMNVEDRTETAERLLRNVSDRFQANIGRNHRETLSIQKALARSAFRRQKLTEAITYLKGVLVHPPTVASLDTYDHCGILVELALCYKYQKKYDEVIRWTQAAWEKSLSLDSAFHQADVQVRCSRTLAWVEAKSKRWNSARFYAQQAVLISSNLLGKEDSLTALVAVELQDLEAESLKFWLDH